MKIKKLSLKWHSRSILFTGILVVGVVVAAAVGVKSFTDKSQNAEAVSPLPSQSNVAKVAPLQPVIPPTSSPASPRNPSPHYANPGIVNLDVFAEVGHRKITREQVYSEALRRHGKTVLQMVINKAIIQAECQRLGEQVTRKEVNAEIERLCDGLRIDQKQFFEMLKKEREMTQQEYETDIIWPQLALKKIAGKEVEITPEEFKKALEANYGEKARIRLIACNDLETAKKAHGLAVAAPESFGELAKQYSVDRSAGLLGMVPPVSKHGSFPNLEKSAFATPKGTISEIFQVGPSEKYYFLKKEETLKPQQVSDEVKNQLRKRIELKKLQASSGKLYQRLQEEAKVQNIMNDPVASKQYPGVAAAVNGKTVTLHELAVECTRRHGKSILDQLIGRALIENACQEHNIVVTEEDVQAEIAKQAMMNLPTLEGEKPDLEGFVKWVEANKKTPFAFFKDHTLWPIVALEKLVASSVQVTDEDIRKGFEANYGERVKCRAIFFEDQEKASKVWELARKNGTVEYFGELAELYSVEGTSRSMQGTIPPIPRHSGNLTIETQAFNLKKGELSHIFQSGKYYVILLCEGRVPKINVAIEDVATEIRTITRERKQQIAKFQFFDKIKRDAVVINHLTGKITRPQKDAAPKTLARTASPAAGTPRPLPTTPPASTPNSVRPVQYTPEKIQKPTGAFGSTDDM